LKIKTIIPLQGNEALAGKIASAINAEVGEVSIRPFPDGETYVRILSDVKDKEVIIVATLHYPDDKLLPLYFLTSLLKDSGVKKITLVAPYLAYMRQDKKFQPGEAVTSGYFASLISTFADRLITIDPHLHRRHSMSEIYTIPCTVIHASSHISEYINKHIQNPLLIGPDAESEQWVSMVAKEAQAPFIILQKERLGDNSVKVSIPQVEQYRNHTPVLVDDIISTARTMIESVKHLSDLNMKPPICIGVHAVFAGRAYEDLLNSGVEKVITCNTIPHISNQIDLSQSIIEALNY
jgi:ribose-phosphate pyrophosphokinase